ncbi:MAG: tyrosine--tRNA ligase, partial [Cellulosilyticaceae bacterium]
FGMTFSLLTNSEGKKMGKTENGAVWLDPKKTSPYDFYQYWRNIADADVKKCLSLLTFLPIEEVNALSNLDGSEINKAKEKLAFEVTKIVHGQEEAQKAEEGAKAAFSGKGAKGSLPTTEIAKSEFEEGLNIITLVVDKMNLVASRSEARRLIEQKGLKLEGKSVESLDQLVILNDFTDGSLMIQKGKKVFHQVDLI